MANDAFQFGLLQHFEADSASGSSPGSGPDRKIYGVTVATVINNIDATGEARVQLMLPWMPLMMPWARVATMSAGMMRGSFFIPMIGDEVLVAFNQGDIREPFVIGSLWNTLDRPPSPLPTDALNKRLIRTPLGHELSFDEITQTVTLTTNTMSAVTLDPTKAQISTPTASVTVGVAGDVTVSAATRLTLDAALLEINAAGALTINASSITIKASGNCTIQGAVVAIN